MVRFSRVCNLHSFCTKFSCCFRWVACIKRYSCLFCHWLNSCDLISFSLSNYYWSSICCELVYCVLKSTRSYLVESYCFSSCCNWYDIPCSFYSCWSSGIYSRGYPFCMTYSIWVCPLLPYWSWSWFCTYISKRKNSILILVYFVSNSLVRNTLTCFLSLYSFVFWFALNKSL